MRKRILDILHTHGVKHFSRKIKNTPDIYEFILQYTGDSISEKVYNFLYPNENVCTKGNKKTFNSVTYGYRYCGKAATCDCARISVASKCKDSKSKMTEDEIKKSNSKREQTNIRKYNVTNIGQIDKAKKSHAEFYADQSNIDSATLKNKKTKFRRYGNENYNNPTQISETFKKKSPHDWAIIYNNENYILLRDKVEMEKLLKIKSPLDIAVEFGVHVQTVYRHLNILGIRDPYKSYAEMELVGFLQSLGITNIIRNTRKLISKEVDIYLPDYNMAIEYDGVFWHHEDVPHINKEYHSAKFKECEKKGIQLITIFSSFWNNKKDIVKKLLRNKLGLDNDNAIFARKCNVVEVKCKDIKDFLNCNHVQGYTTSSINLALEYEGNIVAVMTFGKIRSRTALGKSEDGFELIRFASSNRVIGGASKLLKYFIRQYNPVKIISYSNNEWSTGNLYSTLGFTLEHEISPSYWYVYRDGILLHRYNFAKHKLVKKGYDEKLTEREITKSMKLLKVWDCGKKRWVLEF